MNAQMCMFKLLKALHSLQDLTEMASCVSSYYTVKQAYFLPRVKTVYSDFAFLQWKVVSTRAYHRNL